MLTSVFAVCLYVYLGTGAAAFLSALLIVRPRAPWLSLCLYGLAVAVFWPGALLAGAAIALFDAEDRASYSD